MKEVGEQPKKAKRNILRSIWCALMICMSVMLNVQAQDITERIEGQDSVYVNGSYQPRAETKDESSLDSEEDGGSLNLCRSGKTAYYGAQLETVNERYVYTALAEASKKGQIRNINDSDTGIVIKLGQKVTLPAVNATNSAAYQKFCNEVGKAIDAFLFDYSENYWIYGYRWSPSKVTINSSQYMIYTIKLWFTDYYKGIRTEAGSTEAELNRIAKKIDGNSRYEIVKKAYEEVIRLVEYAYGDEDYMPYHTITGGLLDKYGHRGVCDCYARIFRLLCQKKGIACILVQGGSEIVNGQIKVDHIWNYVQMEDGKWYLVDCTWDDLETDTPRMAYFLAGSETPGVFASMVGQDHLPTGRFTDSAYRPFAVPVLSRTAYTAWQDSETEPEKAVLSNTNLSLTEGTIKELTARTVPEAFPTDKLEWRSSNNNVVSITDLGSAGKAYVTAQKAGMADITVSYKNKALASCHIVVKAKQPAVVYKIKLNVSSLPMQVKKTTKALQVVSCMPGDSVKEWRSSNPKCVKVDKKTGKLTALRKGTATITAVSQKGASASCKVTVQSGRVATQKLTLNKTVLELKKGKSQKLQIIRTPLTATDKLSYKSSNKKVASVSASGTVKARKKGTATITVRSASGKTVKIKIKVK